jgi:hypothetical protein
MPQAAFTVGGAASKVTMRTLLRVIRNTVLNV